MAVPTNQDFTEFIVSSVKASSPLRVSVKVAAFSSLARQSTRAYEKQTKVIITHAFLNFNILKGRISFHESKLQCVKPSHVIFKGVTEISYIETGLSHFMILHYLLSSLFSRAVLQTQAENILAALEEPPVKRERTTNNAKSLNGIGLGWTSKKWSSDTYQVVFLTEVDFRGKNDSLIS